MIRTKHGWSVSSSVNNRCVRNYAQLCLSLQSLEVKALDYFLFLFILFFLSINHAYTSLQCHCCVYEQFKLPGDVGDQQWKGTPLVVRHLRRNPPSPVQNRYHTPGL